MACMVASKAMSKPCPRLCPDVGSESLMERRWYAGRWHTNHYRYLTRALQAMLFLPAPEPKPRYARFLDVWQGSKPGQGQHLTKPGGQQIRES